MKQNLRVKLKKRKNNNTKIKINNISFGKL